MDQAAEGVVRATFGFGSQSLAQLSLYVERPVKERFLSILTEHSRNLVKIGDPVKKETFLGPLINRNAVDTYLRAAEEARNGGGRFVSGGTQLSGGELENGYFVEPAIVDNLPPTHQLFKNELFVPFLVVGTVDSFDEAMKLANDTEYGLCAGIYSKDKGKLENFFERIEAGVTYANRRAGATTGAWPAVNSFGGWKGSGSTGKSGLGPYYIQQFMREQSADCKWTN